MGSLQSAARLCSDHPQPIIRHTVTSLTMSWQSYVDDQLLSTKVIKNAVIAGHDGNIWATSAGFNASVEELKTLLSRYGSTDELAMNGVKVGGTKYMYISSTDRVVRAQGNLGPPLHQDRTGPDRLRVRGARGPRAGGHRNGEAGRVPHLRGLLGAGARQRLQRACAHETVAEAQHQRKQEHLKIYIILAACHQVNLFYVFQPSSYY